jgi:AraC-like DNA-binding protein/quercetin dioxygenase-like cupin family protein
MVENGHMSVIRQLTYQPVGRPAAAVETMTFDRLRELNDGGTQRADFHVIAVVDAGHGSVTVDFLRHPLGERSAVWVAPGAVHRWDDIADVAGHLVLFVPTAPVTHATRELVACADLVAQWSVPDADWPFVDTARNHLLLEASAPPTDATAQLPEMLLSALIARLRPPHSDARSTNAVFGLFRSRVEAHFREHRDTGRTAKAYIVDRTVLEAKRLLAHDRLTAAGCAHTLGFPDASNFSVFFRKATGMRPGAWQSAVAAPMKGDAEESHSRP